MKTRPSNNVQLAKRVPQQRGLKVLVLLIVNIQRGLAKRVPQQRGLKDFASVTNSLPRIGLQKEFLSNED